MLHVVLILFLIDSSSWFIQFVMEFLSLFSFDYFHFIIFHFIIFHFIIFHFMLHISLLVSPSAIICGPPRAVSAFKTPSGFFITFRTSTKLRSTHFVWIKVCIMKCKSLDEPINFWKALAFLKFIFRRAYAWRKTVLNLVVCTDRETNFFPKHWIAWSSPSVSHRKS